MFLDLMEVLVYTIGINLSISNIIYIYNIASYTSTFYKVIRTIIKYQYLFHFRNSTISKASRSKYKLEEIELKELKKIQESKDSKKERYLEKEIDTYEIINFQ